MEYVNCNVCNIDDKRFLFQAKDLNYSQAGIFNIAQCNNCGLVYLNPRPTKGEIKRFYPNSYYINEVQLINLDTQALWRESGRRLGKILKYKKVGRILDIGCKRGDFLAEFKARGWDVYGIEISPLAAQYAREKYRLNVITGDVLDTNFPGCQFDVITLWQTLEHLHYPVETLREINRIIKENGLLAISIPNFNSFQARIFKEKWFHLDAPRHLFHFSPKTIGLLLKKTGFQIQTLNHFSLFHNYVGLRKSLLYFLRMHRHYPLTKEKKLTKDKFSFLKFIFNNCCKYFSILENLLKHGGTIEVYAKKKAWGA